MANAKKLPSGNWRVRILVGTIDGKKRYKSFTAKSKRECETTANQYLADKHNPDAGIIGTCIDNYINLKAPVLSPATVAGYRRIWRTIKADFDWFYNTDADRLTSKTFQKFINLLAVDRKPKTVANYHGLIFSALKLEHVNVPEVRLPSKVRYDVHIPSEAEMKRLFELLKGTEMEIIVLLAALGPMRRGEIRALQLDDIQGNIVHVCKAAVENESYDEVVKNPKTYDSDRYIEYPQYVIDRIHEQGYVCNMPLRMISKRFERFLAKNDFEHFRFHDLRHFGCSILHAIGLPDSYIMERGGWKTDGVMKTVYRHTISDEAKSFNNMVNEHFENMIEK